MIKIEWNMSKLWHIGCKNIILTIVHLLVLLCELFINALIWIILRLYRNTCVKWKTWSGHLGFHSKEDLLDWKYTQTERQATKYKTRQVYMQHCLHGLNNLASDIIILAMIMRWWKWMGCDSLHMYNLVQYKIPLHQYSSNNNSLVCYAISNTLYADKTK
jgi:hypothetical protein